VLVFNRRVYGLNERRSCIFDDDESKPLFRFRKNRDIKHSGNAGQRSQRNYATVGSTSSDMIGEADFHMDP